MDKGQMPTTAAELRAIAAKSDEIQRKLCIDEQLTNIRYGVKKAAESGKMTFDFRVQESAWVPFIPDLIRIIHQEFPGVHVECRSSVIPSVHVSWAAE